MDARRPLPRFKAGDPFPSARQLNDLVDRINRQRLASGQGTNVLTNETPNGTTIRVESGATRELAQTSTVITARSGSTAGTGTVNLCTVDPNSRLITVGSVTRTVLNFSGTPGTGIPSGKYCWIEQDPYGNWWIVSVEC